MLEMLPAMAVFARVVELESFSAAARSLGLSKSAVSKTVSRLEDRLATRLINRTTRKLSLTEAGAAYYEGCQRTLAEAEAAEQAVGHLAAAPRGTLRVNAPMSFGVSHLAPLLPAFLGEHRGLALDLAFEDRLVDLVEEGFDVAIRIGALADSSLVARRLSPIRRVVCAAPDYLDARGRPQRPEALAGHDCLLYTYQMTGDTWRFAGAEGEKSVRVAGRFRANNGEALRHACLAGYGIAFSPTFLVGEDLRAGRLERLLPAWRDGQEAAVHAVYPASRNLSPKVRVFVDFLAARFSQRPYWDEGLDLS